MQKVGIVVAIALAATACRGKASSSASDSVAKLAELKDKMCACKDAACAKAVSDEMIRWGREDPKAGIVEPGQTKRATDLGAQLGECMMRANGMNPQAPSAGSATATADSGSGSAGSGSSAGSAGSDSAGSDTGSASATLGTSGLPRSCEDYKAAVDRLATCDKLSKQARETLAKGYTDAAAKWASMPASARESLAVSCQGGTDAVIAVAKTQCGW